MRKEKKNQKGFTLVELVIVVAILAVLVTLIVPKIMGNVQDAKKNTEIGNARTLASEISVWNAKQADNTTWVKDGSDADTTISATEYDLQLDLPAGITWPSGTHATITVDTSGNAYVNLITPPAGP